MAICRTLTLYGPAATREHAKLLLENQPQVRRVDASPGSGQLRLFLNMPIREEELITLLVHSGISGFSLA